MMYIAIVGLIYILVNELEDRSIKNRWQKWTEFLNTGEAWKNKYALDSDGSLIPYKKKWYYFGIHPSYKERFLYSSTIFVFVTDGEHLFQFIKNIAILVGFFIIDWLLAIAWFIGARIGTFIKEIIKKIQ